METVILGLIQHERLWDRRQDGPCIRKLASTWEGKTNVSTTKLINTFYSSDLFSRWNLLPFGLNPWIHTWLHFETFFMVSADHPGLVSCRIILSIAPASMYVSSVFPLKSLHPNSSPSPISIKYASSPSILQVYFNFLSNWGSWEMILLGYLQLSSASLLYSPLLPSLPLCASFLPF